MWHCPDLHNLTGFVGCCGNYVVPQWEVSGSKSSWWFWLKSTYSVKQLQEKLSRLLSNSSCWTEVDVTGTLPYSHINTTQTDKQTCDFSLKSFWRFGGEKMICISACWQMPEGLVASFCIKQSLCLLRSVSSPSVPSSHLQTFTHSPTISSRLFSPASLWPGIRFNSLSIGPLMCSTVPTGGHRGVLQSDSAESRAVWVYLCQEVKRV